jgi:heme-degrading monooxygenase HmoA
MPTGDRPGARAVLTMSVPSGATDTFEAEWSRVAQWVAGQHGCLRQTLARGAGPEPVYVITSDWADLATYQRFERSEAQDAMTSGLRALRTTARMEVLTIVDHRETG